MYASKLLKQFTWHALAQSHPVEQVLGYSRCCSPRPTKGCCQQSGVVVCLQVIGKHCHTYTAPATTSLTCTYPDKLTSSQCCYPAAAPAPSTPIAHATRIPRPSRSMDAQHKYAPPGLHRPPPPDVWTSRRVGHGWPNCQLSRQHSTHFTSSACWRFVSSRWHLVHPQTVPPSHHHHSIHI